MKVLSIFPGKKNWEQVLRENSICSWSSQRSLLGSRKGSRNHSSLAFLLTGEEFGRVLSVSSLVWFKSLLAECQQRPVVLFILHRVFRVQSSESSFYRYSSSMSFTTWLLSCPFNMYVLHLRNCAVSWGGGCLMWDLLSNYSLIISFVNKQNLLSCLASLPKMWKVLLWQMLQ